MVVGDYGSSAPMSLIYINKRPFERDYSVTTRPLEGETSVGEAVLSSHFPFGRSTLFNVCPNHWDDHWANHGYGLLCALYSIRLLA